MDSHEGPSSPGPPACNYLIRSFRREDLPVCTQLYVEGLIGGRMAENDTGVDIDDIELAYMRSPGSHFWVAEMTVVKAVPGNGGGEGNGGSSGAVDVPTRQIIGMVGVQQHEESVGEIRRLRVSREYRRRGIGSALLETALKFCRDRGYLKIALDTFMEREPAIRLFEKFHFRHSRTRNVMGKDVMHFYLDLYHREGRGGHDHAAT